MCSQFNTLYGIEDLPSKACVKCGEEKTLDKFHARTKKKSGGLVGNVCKVCNNRSEEQLKIIKKAINFKQDDPELTCACCGVTAKELFGHRYLKNPWCVDHDHVTGEFRAIICRDCNSGLSMFRDDPELLKKAYNFLVKFHKKRSKLLNTEGK